VACRLHELSIDMIKTDGNFLRQTDYNAVSELARSIQANGLLQPILVRPFASRYEIVFGYHRLEACKRLGWKSIPAIVKEMSDDEAFVAKVVENLQRNIDVNPIAEAKGYVRLIEHGWTIDRIAQQIGKSDSYVSDRIGLLRRLHPVIANRISNNHMGHLKPSHCELLARLDSKRRQLELAHLIDRKRLSVRRLEKLISGGLPFRETLQQDENALWVRLPQEIIDHMSIRAGDSVYVYAQSRRRIAIEPITLPTARAKDTLIVTA
jgi:ParB family chromosome partitioning protein